MVRLAIFVFLVGSVPGCVLAAGKTHTPCEIHTKNNNFQVVQAKSPQERVSFRDVKDPTALEAPNLKSYLLVGDLVTTDDIPTITDYGKKTMPRFICVEYRGLTGKTVQGWISSDNLLQVVDTNSPGDYSRLSDPVESLLKSLPVKADMPPGKVWQNGSRKLVDNPFEIQLVRSPDQKTLSFKFAEQPAVSLQDRKASAFLDPASADLKCGVAAFLFNNALLVQAEVSGLCWGNHGDSNPSGAYFPK